MWPRLDRIFWSKLLKVSTVIVQFQIYKNISWSKKCSVIIHIYAAAAEDIEQYLYNTLPNTYLFGGIQVCSNGVEIGYLSQPRNMMTRILFFRIPFPFIEHFVPLVQKHVTIFLGCFPILISSIFRFTNVPNWIFYFEQKTISIKLFFILCLV